MSDREAVSSTGPRSRRFGPFRVPKIACDKCGTEHHYDAANGEYQGRCRNCSGFLRRPTEAEHSQFTDFLMWNTAHMERGRSA